MNPWRTFFDHYAPLYLQEVFTLNSEAEVRFLLDELTLPPGAWILDVGCGVGRHAVLLAQAGLRVVGVDLSSGMPRQGQARACELGVSVDWVQADASCFGFGGQFQAAICCLWLGETDEGDHGGAFAVGHLPHERSRKALDRRQSFCQERR